MEQVSRRMLLPAGLAATTVGGTAARAEAKNTYARWDKTPVPTRKELHYANRFAYGMTPSTLKAMRKAGSPEKWFQQQLNPTKIKESAASKNLDGFWPDLFWDWQTLLAEWKKDQDLSWLTVTNHCRWSLLKRVYSNHSVKESMTDFLENYLNIPIYDDSVFFFRASYGQMLRSKAFTSFEEILYNAITHPAMSLALDNNASHKDAPNENLGRELLELYSVGRGNYTEDDVKNSAKILTGWTVAAWQTWEPKYRPDYHYTGRVTVMGFTHPNTDTDGREVTRAYLKYLAQHPATAKKFCRALAVRFVSDNPSNALVNELTRVYLKNKSAIKPVLKALVAHDDFMKNVGKKAKTPADEIVSLYRILGVKVKNPPTNNDKYAANQIAWSNQYLGLQALNWPRPDAPPDDQTTWSTVGRILASLEVHWGMSGRWWPNEGITYKTYEQWIPKENMRVDQLVDHMSRLLHGKKASVKTVNAASKLLAMKPTDRVTRDSGLYEWKMPFLLAMFLDAPENFVR